MRSRAQHPETGISTCSQALELPIFSTNFDGFVHKPKTLNEKFDADMMSCPQKFQSPLILDDTYEFAEAVGLNITRDFSSGRLASSDIETAVLSMSSYEQSQNPHVKGKWSFESSMSIVEP